MRLRPAQPQTYAERTHASPFRIVRFAHRRRYELVKSLALDARPEVVLDYGAGYADMLLSMLGDPDAPPGLRAIAYEPLRELVVAHLERNPELDPDKRLELVESLDDVPDASCDVVTCAGVLEHLNLNDRFSFYAFARRALRPGGRVVIDVPVEIGPAVLIKTAGRRLLKSYDREYSLGEMLAAGVGMTVFDPQRFDPGFGEYFVSHKGFDYRLLRAEVEAQGFSVERTVASPVTWLPAGLVNQEVLLVASPASPPAA